MGTDIHHIVRDSRDDERVFSFIDWGQRYYAFFDALCGVRKSNDYITEPAFSGPGFSPEVASWISEDNNIKYVPKGKEYWEDYWLGDHDHGHVRVVDILPSRLTKLRRWPVIPTTFPEYVKRYRRISDMKMPAVNHNAWLRYLGSFTGDLDLMSDEQIEIMLVHDDYPTKIYHLGEPISWDPDMVDYFYDSVVHLEKDADFVTIDFGFDS